MVEARKWATDWQFTPDETHALGHAFDTLWHLKELEPYFKDREDWSILFKCGAPTMAPMPDDIKFFETLTRIALGKLSDLPDDDVLECGERCTITEHRKSLRNFRARNLGIED